ncbi:MAG: tyrosine-protein phosphatase [Planctomycetes bacterium]|nr:tyrosine-protein phosphatase [Planctomycetota bacterium]
MRIRHPKLLFGAVPLLLLGLAYGVKEARSNLVWNNFGVVEAGRIYRSGKLRTPHLQEVLATYGIRTVVHLAHHADDLADREEEALVTGKGLRYVKRRWAGNGVVPPERLRWVADILSDPANHPVLIHCVSGKYRSGVAVASYRILEAGWPVERAREEMERFGYERGESQELERRIEELARSRPPAPEPTRP